MSAANLILDTDSYKFGHYLQYPPGTAALSSYIETRGAPDLVDVQFFGLQMFLKDALARPVTRAHVEEAEAIVTAHGQPFNRAGWMHIVEAHGGFLPLVIEALPEGVVTRRGVPLVQVANTDPACAWLVSHIETALIRAVWYPSTVAGTVRRIKLALAGALERTSDTPEALLPTRLLDYGARGVASYEQAGIGGVAHLLHFTQTDTMPAIVYARRFYGAEMAGTSMPASEHSTMTAWGGDREAEAFSAMIDQFAPVGAFAVVSDSYDIATAVSETWGKRLRDKVKASGATVHIRPDSGDPIETPIQVIQQLDYRFGSTPNRKGFKVLDRAVRVIQGDGITLSDMNQILSRLEAFGYAAENISFAMGSRILQRVDRDQFGFTMKANARLDSAGKWHDVWKRPATMNVKATKAGRQAVVTGGLGLEAVRLDQLAGRENLLQPVWRNGALLKDWSLREVRARAAQA